MASKNYTAREMRQAANAEELVGRPGVAAMLRQAADTLEREAAKGAEIERLREIVKELADELETMICNEIVKSSKRHGK